MPLPMLLRPHVTRITRHAAAAFSAALAVIVALATVFVVPARAQDTSLQRVHGPDRVTTAVAASQHSFDDADHVLLTTSDDYPDALAAAAYASERSAPVLLTPGGSLPSTVAKELRRLDPRVVTVLGGERAVGTKVVRAVEDLGIRVERIAGETRYDTARKLARKVGAGSGKRVALALGVNSGGAPGWADALSAGALAVADNPIPTLLTARGELPPATRKAIQQLSPETVVIVGGEAAVSRAVEKAVADLGPDVERLAGRDRYQTSVAVTAAAHSAGVPRGDVLFVSGENYPDALGAAAVAANERATMLLVPSGRLSNSVDAHVRKVAYDGGVLVGGPAAVAKFVASELAAALSGATRPTPPPPPKPKPKPEPAKPSYKGYTFKYDLAVWDRLARCESSGNWSINTGNGYYGGLQFSLSSWRAVGGSGYPHRASRLEQIYRGERLQAIQGWRAWPACTRKLGMR